MKKIMILTAIVALCGFSARAYATETLTAFQIADKAYHIEDGNDCKSFVEMVITKSDGNEKTRHLSFGRKDFGEDSRSLIVFTGPADVKGTSFLTWTHVKDSNDQWLFLPALKKTKRIGTSSQSDSFMGSDFSYEDMSKRSTSKDNYRIIGNETVDSADCYVLEALAKDKTEAFVKRIIWVRKDNFIIIKAEFYDDKGSLCKRYTAGDIQKINNINTILFFRMDDLKNGSHSTMKLSNVTYNSGLPDRMFSVQGLK